MASVFDAQPATFLCPLVYPARPPFGVSYAQRPDLAQLNLAAHQRDRLARLWVAQWWRNAIWADDAAISDAFTLIHITSTAALRTGIVSTSTAPIVLFVERCGDRPHVWLLLLWLRLLL